MDLSVFYVLLIFVMVLWMSMKVGRQNTGMGFLTFMCWPIAVIPLITNWGDKDSDIRLQFLVTLVASVLFWNTGYQSVSRGIEFTPEEIAVLREEDPVFAEAVEREQSGRSGEIAGTRVEFSVEDTGSASTFGSVSIEPTSGRRPPRLAAALEGRPGVVPLDPVPGQAAGGAAVDSGIDFAAAPAKVHATPLREIRFRRGDIHLDAAFASIEVPEHFRFIARHQLGLLSELRDIPVPDQTLGWIVHERVNLNSADFWFVEVQFREVGHLKPPTPATPPSGLEWNADRMVAQWSQPAQPAARGLDFLSAKLLRHGVLLFRVPELKDADQELGIRVSRLMASRAQADGGWAHSEFVGGESTASLVEWVRSLQSGAESTVTAEADSAGGERSS